MTKTISVTYSITCETQDEFDEVLASIDGHGIFSLDSEDEGELTVAFSGEYEV